MKNQKNHCLNIKVEGLETDSFELEEEFISAEGKVDLDGDGKEDTILFAGDSSFGYLREVAVTLALKQSGTLQINDNSFSLAPLSTYDITIDRPNRILDIYILLI